MPNAFSMEGDALNSCRGPPAADNLRLNRTKFSQYKVVLIILPVNRFISLLMK